MKRVLAKAQAALVSRKGEGYIDTAVKILIAVVCGALVLGALYFILKENVLTTVKTKVSDMFGSTPTNPLS